MNENVAGTVTENNVRHFAEKAATYDEDEPHTRPENAFRVRESITQALRNRHGTWLDVCCGTGFVLNATRGLYARAIGVDASDAMLGVARSKKLPDAKFIRGSAFSLPVDDASIDVVTCYAGLHHLACVPAAIAEFARVLRKGGLLWTGLDPSAEWFARALPLSPDLPKRVEVEVRKMARAVAHGVEPYAVPGVNAWSIRSTCLGVGFSYAVVRYDWFLGQAVYENGLGANKEESAVIECYLRSVLPVSAPFFKYVGVEALR